MLRRVRGKKRAPAFTRPGGGVHKGMRFKRKVEQEIAKERAKTTPAIADTEFHLMVESTLHNMDKDEMKLDAEAYKVLRCAMEACAVEILEAFQHSASKGAKWRSNSMMFRLFSARRRCIRIP